jgi:hypothetical protein
MDCRVDRRTILAWPCGISVDDFAQGSSQTARGPIAESQLPNHLQRYLETSIERLTQPSKERVQSTGLIEVGSSSGSSVQRIREYPGKLQIVGCGKKLAAEPDGIICREVLMVGKLKGLRAR